MRIKSSFRDYYDSIQAMGYDDLLFVRETREVNINFPVLHAYSWYQNDFYMGCVIFCRKIYPYVMVDYSYKVAHYFYSLESIVKAMGEEWLEKKSSRWKRTLSEFFKFTGQLYDTQEPIIQLGKYYDYTLSNSSKFNGRINPRLSIFEFQRVMDPYTAYQELQMFLSNQANPEPKMVQVSDKTKAIKAGHGGKYSFRTPPKVSG